jgi:hypothetical protein
MMNPKHETDKDLIFHTLHQNWECAVSFGLRDLTDDDLLRLLSEVDSQSSDADDAVDEAFAEAPDWDDKSDSELEAIACQFERQLAGGTSSSATPIRTPLRRRQPSGPSRLSFEELESRFTPSTLTVVARGCAVYAPALSARWEVAEERPASATWEISAPATVAFHGDALSDPVALSDLALAQVA